MYKTWRGLAANVQVKYQNTALECCPINVFLMIRLYHLYSGLFFERRKKPRNLYKWYPRKFSGSQAYRFSVRRSICGYLQ